MPKAASKMNALRTKRDGNDRRFAHYWTDSGMPAFLTHLIKGYRTNARARVGQDARDIGAAYCDGEHPDWQAVRFQAGYLTLQPDPAAGTAVTVFPNREAEQSFLTSLLASYAQEPREARVVLSALTTALQAGDYAAFGAQFNALPALIPYAMHIRRHTYYPSLLHLACALMGLPGSDRKSVRIARGGTRSGNGPAR